MNISDSMKYILKNKSHIFTDFWKEDFMNIIADVSAELKHLYNEGRNSFHHVRKDGIKFNIQEVIDAGADTVLIMKVLPSRIKDGFHRFRDEMTHELESLSDSKQKTIFILKVIGALSSFTLSTVYSVKKSTSDFRLSGLKRKNAFTHFLIAELIFRISHALVQRFLRELENQVTHDEELKHIRYFQELLSKRESDEALTHQQHEHGDRAIEIVENLKKYIMTGKA